MGIDEDEGTEKEISHWPFQRGGGSDRGVQHSRDSSSAPHKPSSRTARTLYISSPTISAARNVTSFIFTNIKGHGSHTANEIPFVRDLLTQANIV